MDCRNNKFCRSLTQADRDKLCAHCTLRPYKKGQVIYREDITSYLVVVVDGVSVTQTDFSDDMLANGDCPCFFINTNGLVLGIPQTLEYFQRMQDRITNFVTQNSGMSKERFTTLAMNTQELVMDVGTVLDGPDAVEEGLIDSLGSLSDAMDCLGRMIDQARKKKKTASAKKKAD